ncbi:MAG: DUF3429 domain-containing protein [Sphingomonas sp. 28-62-20]|uniref:DUF3429 domain-containing protein n=1 Tax=Sphingomonas sp. 28-62-20 TaxID=1970433 RepID=UPI000BD30902|nr:MAG: DUF3429 domain-containing protein [Sphingomonas sp. 28-62-20]
MTPPSFARLLGAAGLLPQLAVAFVLLEHNNELRFSALAMGYAYAALILSFLGGLWWGLAAKTAAAPAWLWAVAVLPSLIALGSAAPWAVGEPWPGPSLIVLGVALIAALGVDWQLQRTAIAPPWWLKLRVPLSAGLGTLTILLAYL